MKEIEKESFDEFLTMSLGLTGEERKVMVFCEECHDNTIISTKTGVQCGHRPKWLDELDEFVKHERD